jgi:hypothetical protein
MLPILGNSPLSIIFPVSHSDSLWEVLNIWASSIYEYSGTISSWYTECVLFKFGIIVGLSGHYPRFIFLYQPTSTSIQYTTRAIFPQCSKSDTNLHIFTSSLGGEFCNLQNSLVNNSWHIRERTTTFWKCPQEHQLTWSYRLSFLQFSCFT